MPGAFHGGVPGRAWPDEDSHSLRTDLRGPPHQALGPDATFLYLFNKAHLQDFISEVLQAWMISQIPGGVEGLDQLVCVAPGFCVAVGKTLAQKAYDRHDSSERTALQELLSPLNLEVVLIQGMRCIRRRRFSMVPGAGVRRPPDSEAAGFFEGVNQSENPYRQIGAQCKGKRHIPLPATDQEMRHGCLTTWDLSAKKAPEHIKSNWPGSAWIVEVVTTTRTRKGTRMVACHRFITSIRTTPEALRRLIRQRLSIENEWHWARDAQLGEDAHRYANRTGATEFSLLRTIAMNLLRLGSYRSIRQGLITLLGSLG